MTHIKQSILKLTVVSAFALGSVTSAFAGTVGGSVTAINTLVDNYSSAINIGSSTAGAANGQTDTTIVGGTIDNNYDRGWKLTVTSTNLGKLKLGAGGAGREILYTSVKFVSGTGTLGAGLTDPSTVAGGVLVVTSPAVFDTRTTGSGGSLATATTATVAFAYSLKISWSSDLTLLAGSYTDTITLALVNDV